MVAQARANRFKLEHAIEDVNNQVAVLRANVAALQTAEARQARAKADYDRAIDVSRTPGAISQQDVDLRKEAFRVAEARVKQALEQVYQIRVELRLAARCRRRARTERSARRSGSELFHRPSKRWPNCCKAPRRWASCPLRTMPRRKK